ncbi:RCC1/BLIP-II [Clavulina sp. PMI_390]|nr:RCC1/BLIP-II [Clavulina sp. PMI_390]
MAPRRAATKTEEAPAASRPSRKRAADESEPEPAKRPRRAASVKPAEKPAPKARAAAASVAKDAKASKNKENVSTKKAPAKSAKAKATAGSQGSSTTTKKSEKTKDEQPKPKVARVAKPKEPTFNALVPIPSPRAYPVHTYVFGNGDAGQFGLGPDVMDEIPRPRLQTWIEEGIKEGRFGPKGTGFESLVAGGMHSIAISSDGRLWSWGVNDEGALGREVVNVPNPEKPGEFLDREELESWPTVVSTLEEKKFRPVFVGVGDSLTIAVNEEGHAMGWGIFRSASGKLGFQADSKAEEIKFLPVTIPGVENVQFCAMECGPNHAIGLTLDGKVYVWGAGENGQLGRRLMSRRPLNSTRPDPLALRKIRAVGAGFFHSFAVDDDGVVYAWGLNQYGQLGLPKSEDKDEPSVWVPTVVPGLDPSVLGGARVTQISAGEHHSAFLLDDGRVYAVGRCDSGQLGIAEDHPEYIKMKEADEDYISTPVQVFFPPIPTKDEPAPELPPYKASDAGKTINKIVKIDVAGRFSLALSESGNVYSWGTGLSGQLGLGANTEEQATPARVRWKGGDDWFVEDISAGGQHCFLLASEKVRQDFN